MHTLRVVEKGVHRYIFARNRQRWDSSTVRTRSTAATVSLFALLSAPTPAFAQTAGYEHPIRIGSHEFKVELALDDEKRTRGMMFRNDMPPDAGMLFVFDDQQPLAFWMRNTRIPLDIIYFNREGKRVSIQPHAPPCRTERCPTFPSTGEAMYVVELNGGRAAELGLGAADALCSNTDAVPRLPRCR